MFIYTNIPVKRDVCGLCVQGSFVDIYMYLYIYAYRYVD